MNPTPHTDATGSQPARSDYRTADEMRAALDAVTAERDAAGTTPMLVAELRRRIEDVTKERDDALAKVASYDRQDELIGTEFEGVDEVTDVILLLKQQLRAERTARKAAVEALKEVAMWCMNNAKPPFSLKAEWNDGTGSISGSNNCRIFHGKRLAALALAAALDKKAAL